MEILFSLSLIVRTAIYLWVGVEAIFLYYLYNYGYQQYKPTTIISVLSKFFLSLGIFFMLVAFIPIFSYSDHIKTEDFFVRTFASASAAVVGYLLLRFRDESLKSVPQRNPLLKKEE